MDQKRFRAADYKLLDWVFNIHFHRYSVVIHFPAALRLDDGREEVTARSGLAWNHMLSCGFLQDSLLPSLVERAASL